MWHIPQHKFGGQRLSWKLRFFLYYVSPADFGHKFHLLRYFDNHVFNVFYHYQVTSIAFSKESLLPLYLLPQPRLQEYSALKLCSAL